MLCLDAGPPSPADHLRDVFYRMGLDDKVILILFSFVLFMSNVNIFVILNILFDKQEIVALSGAHTLGRARPDRSGWGKPETKYTVLINDKLKLPYI